MAPAPAAVPSSTRRYVANPTALVYREPNRRSTAVERLQIGTSVDVSLDIFPAEHGVEKFRQLQSGARSGGFIAEEELSSVAPTVAESLTRAREALGRGELDAAVEQASRATALDAGSREAWDLLAAIHDARADVRQAREVYARRAALPPLSVPPETTSTWPAPKPGEQRFVEATKLRVRKAASRTAPILTELPLNTEVEVLAVDGEFARVRWIPRESKGWILDLSDAASSRPLSAEGATPEGYVGAAYLAPRAATKEQLIAQADEAERKNTPLEAARTLERATLVAPDDLELLRRLTRLAAAAKLYPIAASAAVKLSAGTSTARAAPGSVQMELLFGCKVAPPTDAAASCLAQVDTVGNCAPCPPMDPLSFAADDITDEERKSLERERDQDQRQFERDTTAHEKERKKLAAQVEKQRRQYPNGPWFHATIEGDAKLHAEGRRVFVFALPFTIGGYCDVYESTVSYEAMALCSADIRWPEEGRSLELWVTGGDYENVAWGVVSGTSVEDARAAVQAVPASGESAVGSAISRPEQATPVPIIAGPWQACLCCGC